ncbi:MAG: hypothetical protein E4H39_00585 [Syntrophobacterales bacterium]|nr:MAG: hypothetical protein E4H39_00585 [Syntrophobacterales bacterium]
MAEHSAFVSILLITLLAALMPLLSARFRRFNIPIPIVIFEILAGIVIGKTGFNLVTPTPILDFLAEFGFVFLMFISGLEIDISSLFPPRMEEKEKSFLQHPFALAFIGFVLTLLTAIVAAVQFRRMGLVGNPLIMVLILSTSSLGIILPVLKERNLVSRRYGQFIIMAALFADFITLILLSLVFGILRQGFFLQIMFSLLFLVLVAMGFRLGFRARNIPWIRDVIEELSTATAQIHVRGSIALMVAWVVLAKALGAEIILGAFVAGIIVNIFAGTQEQVLKDNLDVLGFGFFIPIFFITVGSQIDLKVFLVSSEAMLLLPLLLLAAYVVKVIPLLIFRIAFSWRESIAAGFLLSSRLSLIIASSALAYKMGIIDEAANTAIILLAMVTCTVSPVIFNHIIPAVDEEERKGIIIVGLNQLTGRLAERLHQDGEDIAVLGCDEDRVNLPYCKGTTPIFGDPGDEEILKEAGAGRAGALVTALEDDEANIRVCTMAKERFGIPVIVSRADDHATMEKMQSLGVRVIQPALATVIALEGALMYPAAFDVLSSHGDNVEIGETILRSPSHSGQALKKLRLPGNALIIGIRREGEVIVPHGDTVIRQGDVIMLVGSPDAIKESRILLESRRSWKRYSFSEETNGYKS